MIKSSRLFAGLAVLGCAAASQAAEFSSFFQAGFKGITVTISGSAPSPSFFVTALNPQITFNGVDWFDVTAVFGFYALHGPTLGSGSTTLQWNGNDPVQAALPYVPPTGWAIDKYDNGDHGEAVGYDNNSKSNPIPAAGFTFKFDNLNLPNVNGIGFHVLYNGPGNTPVTQYVRYEGTGQPPQSVPEPFTLGLAAAGLGLALGARLRLRKQ